MYKVLVSKNGETGKHSHSNKSHGSYKSLAWAIKAAKKVFSLETVRAVVVVVKSEPRQGEKIGEVKWYSNKTTGVIQS